MSTLQFAHATPSYWLTILVAALISAAVSVTGLWQTARSRRQDRQRQLFADAFRAVIEYREFAYKIRRRSPEADRTQITDALSAVQTQLNLHMATLDIEAPNVAPVYRALVERTRQVAGPLIAAGWDSQPTQSDTDLHIEDIDLSELADCDRAFVRAAQGCLTLRRRSVKLRDESPSKRRSGDVTPGTTDSEITPNQDPSLDSFTSGEAPEDSLDDVSSTRPPRLKRTLLILIFSVSMAYFIYGLVVFWVDVYRNTREYLDAFEFLVSCVSVGSTVYVIWKFTTWSVRHLSSVSERMFRSW